MLDLPEVRVADGVLAAVSLDHFAGFVDGTPECQRLSHALKKRSEKIKNTTQCAKVCDPCNPTRNCIPMCEYKHMQVFTPAQPVQAAFFNVGTLIFF